MSQSVTSQQNTESTDDPLESPLEGDEDEEQQFDIETLSGAPTQQKRKGGRKPIYATPEERKQRNRQAQAAFRERRTEYIRQLEIALKQNEDTITTLKETHRIATNECLRLRYRSSLLENILLEHGIDLQSELQSRTSSPPMRPALQKSDTANPMPTAQRAILNRHQQAKRKSFNETSSKTPTGLDTNVATQARQNLGTETVVMSPLEETLPFAGLGLSTPTGHRMEPFSPDFAMFSTSNDMMDQMLRQPSFSAAQLPYTPAATISDQSETVDAQHFQDSGPPNPVGRQNLSAAIVERTQHLGSPIQLDLNLDFLDTERPKRPRMLAPLEPNLSDARTASHSSSQTSASPSTASRAKQPGVFVHPGAKPQQPARRYRHSMPSSTSEQPAFDDDDRHQQHQQQQHQAHLLHTAAMNASPLDHPLDHPHQSNLHKPPTSEAHLYGVLPYNTHSRQWS